MRRRHGPVPCGGRTVRADLLGPPQGFRRVSPCTATREDHHARPFPASIAWQLSADRCGIHGSNGLSPGPRQPLRAVLCRGRRGPGSLRWCDHDRARLCRERRGCLRPARPDVRTAGTAPEGHWRQAGPPRPEAGDQSLEDLVAIGLQEAVAMAFARCAPHHRAMAGPDVTCGS